MCVYEFDYTDSVSLPIFQYLGFQPADGNPTVSQGYEHHIVVHVSKQSLFIYLFLFVFFYYLFVCLFSVILLLI